MRPSLGPEIRWCNCPTLSGREEATLSQLNKRERAGHSVPSGVRWKNVVDTERIPVSSAGEFFSQTTFLPFKEEKKKEIPSCIVIVPHDLFLFFLFFLMSLATQTRFMWWVDRLVPLSDGIKQTLYFLFVCLTRASFPRNKGPKKEKKKKKCFSCPSLWSQQIPASSIPSCPVSHHQHSE